jgi:UDP-N-acetyl-D-galactosamine dehydrogenase
VILAGRETNDAWARGSPTAPRAARGAGGARWCWADLQGKCARPAQQPQRRHRPPARRLGHDVGVADPIADAGEAEREYGRSPIALDGERYDLVVGAVAHDDYRELADERLAALVAPGGTLADLKGMWRERDLTRRSTGGRL